MCWFVLVDVYHPTLEFRITNDLTPKIRAACWVGAQISARQLVEPPHNEKGGKSFVSIAGPHEQEVGEIRARPPTPIAVLLSRSGVGVASPHRCNLTLAPPHCWELGVVLLPLSPLQWCVCVFVCLCVCVRACVCVCRGHALFQPAVGSRLA